MATQKKVAKKSTPKTRPAKKATAKKAAPKTNPQNKKKVSVSGKMTKKAKAGKPVVKKATAKSNIKKATVKKLPAKKASVSAQKTTVKKSGKKSLANHLKSKTAAIVKSKKPAEKVKKPTAKTEAKKAPEAKTPHNKKEVKSEAKSHKVTLRSRAGRPTNVIYQPEFVKSVLDQPEKHNGPIFRYSDAELKEFKDIILRKMEAAKKELVYLQGLITRKDEAGTEDTESKYMSMEDGSGTMEREQLNQMASRQIQFIDHLEKALMRIENKTYGICRVTGKLIDKARLRAVPHATLSIEAKQALNK